LPTGPEIERKLRLFFQQMAAYFGPRRWWPAESPFEVMVGAVLTQNTAWRNAEKAISELARLSLLSPEAMAAASEESLASAIRSSGYANVKARRLKELVGFILSEGSGGLRPSVLDRPMERLRPALLAVKGVGPETADCIVLYASAQPSFVVDAYARRLLSRHGLARGDEPYEAIRSWFMSQLTPDVAFYNEYHALIVAVGHHFCAKGKPKCQECPLREDPGRVFFV
jgi:endonuclease-3 related protein